MTIMRRIESRGVVSGGEGWGRQCGMQWMQTHKKVLGRVQVVCGL